MTDKYLMKDLTKETWRKELDKRYLTKNIWRKTFDERPNLELHPSLYTVAGTKGCVLTWQEFSENDAWEHKQFDVS